MDGTKTRKTVMKAVLQKWWVPLMGGYRSSLSKDRSQLEATRKKVMEQCGKESTIGSPQDVRIPDDHFLCAMIDRGTVFLEKEHMEVIIIPQSP